MLRFWSTFQRVLNKPSVLNMPGLRIWQGCENEMVTQGAEYVLVISQNARICFNNTEYG